MCTLLVALRPNSSTALALSGNRNEFLGRPASGPQLHRAAGPGAPAVAMPRDEKEGGTWLGANDRGLFLCLTNRRGPLEPGRPSRGLLVAEALRQPGFAELRRFLERLRGDLYNGFHLVCAARDEAFVVVCDGARAELRPLGPGLHLVTERSFGAGEGLRERETLERFQALYAAGDPDVEALREPLRAHGAPGEPLESACVHAEARGYGTRSSFQLRLPRAGPVRALFTEGHPCTEPPRDVSGLFAPLFAERGAPADQSQARNR